MLKDQDGSFSDSCVVMEDLPSVFDSVAAPEFMISDSAKFYVQLADILKGFNDFKWSDGRVYLDAYALVDTLGRIHVVDYMVPPSINRSGPDCFKKVLDVLGEPNPAYLKLNTSKKIPFRISLEILLEEETASFMIRAYGRTLYQRSFARPIG